MNKRKVAVLVSLMMICISIITICVCVILPNRNSEDYLNSNTIINRNYDQSKEEDKSSNDSPILVPDGKDDDEDEISDAIKFFVNQSAITKTKEISGETTIFNVSFKLFILNSSDNETSFLINGFSGKYKIGEFGKLFTFKCLNSEKSFSLKANEVKDLDFVATYVITDTDNFKDNDNYDLVISYMLEEVFSVSV